MERVGGGFAFDDGARKEEETETLDKVLCRVVVLLEGVRRDDGNGNREGADVCIDAGTGAGEVATGPGFNADTMDWETSERSMEARFWLFENTSPPSLRPTFPHPLLVTASDLALDINEGGTTVECLPRSVRVLGVSEDLAPSASNSEAVALTYTSISGLKLPRTTSVVESSSMLPRPRSTLVLVLL